MSPQLEAILEQAQGLPREEQLELIRKLTEQRDMQLSDEVKPKRKVTDFYGLHPIYCLGWMLKCGSNNCARSGMNVKPC